MGGGGEKGGENEGRREGETWEGEGKGKMGERVEGGREGKGEGRITHPLNITLGDGEK